MDGKYITITCPSNSGNQYFNYKQFFSIVLFIATDADYNFHYVHLSILDFKAEYSIFCESTPQPTSLAVGREMLTPYVFLADDAFSLTENIYKPYTTYLNRISKTCM
nr:unnamed protein product [Callosobruchus analis]